MRPLLHAWRGWLISLPPLCAGPASRVPPPSLTEGAAEGATKGATEGAAEGATEGATKGAAKGAWWKASQRRCNAQ